MNKKPKVGLFRGLVSILSVLLAISVGLGQIANMYSDFMNSRLGTTNLKVENSGGLYFKSAYSSLADVIKAQETLAEEIGSEGAVLLKNNGALPLNKGSETVTLWGLNSHFPTLGGMIGSSTGYDPSNGQLSYGMEEAMQAKGFSLNQSMLDFYAGGLGQQYARRGFGQTGHGLSPAFTATYEEPSGYPVGEIPPSMYEDSLLSSADGTAAVVVISRDNSEAADYNPDMTNTTEGDSYVRPLALSDYEKGLLDLAKAHSSKVIVLINSDCAVEIEDLKNDDGIGAIVWTGAPGMYGFLGVADVLSGDVNPSGHLPDTYAVSSVSAPAMQNFGLFMYTNNSQSSNPGLTADDKADWYIVETENIYLGYKYYETRYEDSILGQGNATDGAGAVGSSWNYADEVSYPFGYGLSYTTFQQKLVSVDVNPGGVSTAVVEVTNTGSVAGKDVVQLYVQTPYTPGGLEKASIQLLDYAKTGILEPGASETVTIEFDMAYAASYDENTNGGAWVLDAGDYYFAIGNGAHEALNNVLAAKTGSTEGLVPVADTDVIDAAKAVKWTLGSQDIETYSANVENALQNMDINKLIDGAAEYTTRADWTKGWKSVDSLTPTDEMMVGLTNSNYTFTANGDAVSWGVDSGLVAADFMVLDDSGNLTGVKDWSDPAWDQLVDQITLDDAINFIEHAGDNLERIDSIQLPAVVNHDGPLGFTYDQVPGYYANWGSSSADEPTYVGSGDAQSTYAMNTMPTEPMVAATWNKELVEEEGVLFGEMALWSNMNSIIAPGMNLHRTPYCARNHEYYSEDAMLTNLMGVALGKGMQSKGLLAEPKHLAFNHQELNRSGCSTFMTEQAARENELRGFQGVLSGNYTGSVMTAFNRAGTVYAGAHTGLLTQILRNEWGFTGFVITDMINGADYMNWRDMVAAGGTGALTSTAYDASNIGSMSSAANVEKIKADGSFQLQMKQALRYAVYTAINSNLMNNYNTETRLLTVNTWWQNAFIACSVVLGILDAVCAVFYVLNANKASGTASAKH